MKLSVIMGTYNGARYIRSAIESILDQTFTDFEFIICDDCSTDDTFAIIKEYQQRDDRIVLIKNETNLKLAATLNRCLEVAQGEYIARMDDDDIALSHRFQTEVDFLDSHPEYSFVGSSIAYFSGASIWGAKIFDGPQGVHTVYKGFSFVHPTIVVRSSSIKEVGGYTVSPLTTRTEDYDLWCKLYLNGHQGFNLKEILLLYKEDTDSGRRRKFRHRLDLMNLQFYWRKKLALPLSFLIFAFKPLLSGILPESLLLKRRIRLGLSDLEHFVMGSDIHSYGEILEKYLDYNKGHTL
jgi:glycosyltransferase EpsE